MAIIHGVVTIFKTQESANERRNQQVSVKKMKKDMQMEEHRCHTEGTITRAASIGKEDE